MNEISLLEIKTENGEFIHKWEYLDVTGLIRIYYKVKHYEEGDSGVGFDFHALSITSHVNDEDLWGEDCMVEIFYYGYALFDGIRHMYMGGKQTENEGYQHYVNVSDNITFFEKLDDLAKIHCREYEGH